MASRCLNKVMLIGNLTRDPELRYTPSGTAVATFGLATNRRWKTQGGDTKDEAQFHRVVVWNKLAELCSQLIQKGSRVYIEGRIQYREWNDNEGNQRQTTEVVAEDMIVLDRSKSGDFEGDVSEAKNNSDEYDNIPADEGQDTIIKPVKEEKEKQSSELEEQGEEEMPF